ncbi:MAG: hypothetical protein ACOC6R_02860 [Chloroflexota bacterium]
MVDVVDVFHRSVQVLTIVEEAIGIGAKAVVDTRGSDK